MDASTLLSWCPLVTVEDAAGGLGVHGTTFRRHLDDLRNAGEASFHVVGRGGHAKQSWFLTAQRVMKAFPDPYDVPWWLTESGLRSLMGRIEQVHALYHVALNLFGGVGRNWHEEQEPPRFVGCHWIRGPQRRGREARTSGFFGAILTYEGGIRIMSSYAGKQLLESAMVEKYENRFRWLATYSLSGHLERLRHPSDQPDPWVDDTPWTSGVLVIGDDPLSVDIARRSLPREGYRGNRQPYLFVRAGADQGIVEGVAKPRPYDIAVDVPPYILPRRRHLRLPLLSPYDESATAEISARPLVPSTIVDWLDYDIRPDDVAPTLGNPMQVGSPDAVHPEDILGTALQAHILKWAEEWSGLTVKNLARLTHTNRREVGEVCHNMVESGWLQERGDMLYLGPVGIRYVARRDRVAPDTVRARVNNDIAEDHRAVAPHHRHTRAVNGVMIRLHEAGFLVFAGWRMVKDLPELGTQLKPDLVIFAKSKLGEGLHLIEVERTANNPERVKDKLNPHAMVNGWESADRLGYVVGENGTTVLDYLDYIRSPVIFITETAEAELLFRHHGRGLPMLTATLKDVRGGILLGPETVWRLDGEPQSVWKTEEPSGQEVGLERGMPATPNTRLEQSLPSPLVPSYDPLSGLFSENL